jgi:hypothetical protein
MSTYKTSVKYVISQEASGNKLEMGNLYLKNVPVSYAKVNEPVKKMNSEDKAYQMNVFVDSASNDELETLGVNKEMAEVNVTKIKKGVNRGKFKYPVKDADGNDTANAPFAGMFAAQFSRDTVKRNKEDVIEKTYAPLKVVDTEGNPFTADIGNGSICHVKLFVYRNKEGMLNTMMDTVVVVEHVPYIRTDGGDGFDAELGITIKKEPKIDPELADEPKKPAPAKPAASKKPVVEEEIDFDSEIPF